MKKREEVVEEIAGYLDRSLKELDKELDYQALKSLPYASLLNPTIKDEDGNLHHQEFNEKKYKALLLLSKKEKVYFEILSEVSAKWLQNLQGAPKIVTDWICSYLLGKVKKPSAKKHSNLAMKITLATAAYMATKAGFCLRRNETSAHTNSACDIVVEAARKVGIKSITYNSVSEAIRKYQDRF